MALGGVATGNMKAVEQEIVTGIINIKGLIFTATASAVIIGSRVVATAVFDENSVAITARTLTIKIMIGMGIV